MDSWVQVARKLLLLCFDVGNGLMAFFSALNTVMESFLLSLVLRRVCIDVLNLT